MTPIRDGIILSRGEKCTKPSKRGHEKQITSNGDNIGKHRVKKKSLVIETLNRGLNGYASTLTISKKE